MKSLICKSLLPALFLTSLISHAQEMSKSLKPTADDARKIVFRKSAAMEDENFMMRWKFLVKQAGEKAPDFTIRYLNGDLFNLYKELKK